MITLVAAVHTLMVVCTFDELTVGFEFERIEPAPMELACNYEGSSSTCKRIDTEASECWCWREFPVVPPLATNHGDPVCDAVECH